MLIENLIEEIEEATGETGTSTTDQTTQVLPMVQETLTESNLNQWITTSITSSTTSAKEDVQAETTILVNPTTNVILINQVIQKQTAWKKSTSPVPEPKTPLPTASQSLMTRQGKPLNSSSIALVARKETRLLQAQNASGATN